MVGWRVFYGDDTTVDSTQCSPYDVPGRNVQVAASHTPDLQHSTGCLPVHRKDYYWWEPDIEEWSGGDIFGLFDYLLQPGPKKVLFGRTIESAVYRRIIKEACEDRELMRS